LSSSGKTEDDRRPCIPSDELGPGWTFIKKVRSNGTSYRYFYSPNGKMFRSLKKAKELYSSFNKSADVDIEDDQGEVQASEDDDPNLDDIVMDTNDDDDDYDDMLNDSDENEADVKMLNAVTSLKTSSEYEDDNSSIGDDLHDYMAKSDAADIVGVNSIDESSQLSNKKLKRNNHVGVSQTDASSSFDQIKYTTPKRNLFPDETPIVGNTNNEIELLERKLAQLKEAAGNRVTNIASSKGKSELADNIAEHGSVAKQISSSVSQTPTSIVTNFDTAPSGLPVYRSPSNNSQVTNGPVMSCEVTATFTDKKGSNKWNVIFIQGGSELWMIKPPVLNQSSEHMLSSALSGKIAEVFVNWDDTFYRSVPSGKNNIHRRTPRMNDTRVPYPSTKLMTRMKNPCFGFSLENCVSHLQSQLKAMMTKPVIPAHLLNEHLKTDIPILHTKFMQGSYRRDGQKNTPYKDEIELKKYFEEAFQRQFMYGFSRIVYDITLDKFLPDSGIKKFLLSLGYCSFDEIDEQEKKMIYLRGNFPNWDTIEEEPIGA